MIVGIIIGMIVGMIFGMIFGIIIGMTFGIIFVNDTWNNTRKYYRFSCKNVLCAVLIDKEHKK
jgi:hypothetical protein